MLWFVCFFNHADRQSIGSVFPILEQEFGFDKVQLGLIGSAFTWVYAPGSPLAGVLADRFSRKFIILGGCVVWSFFTMSTAWCGSLGEFLTVRALTGLGETLYFPAAMSLISDYHSRDTRSRAMSWHQSAVYAGTILGSWITASIAEKMGWRYPFYFFGPAGMVLAIVLFSTLREPRRGAADFAGGAFPAPGTPIGERLSCKETLAVIFRTPVAALLMVAFLAANFVAVIVLVWTPTFLFTKFNFSLSDAGLSGTIYIHLSSAICVPFAGHLADRLARHYAGGRMAVQAAGLALGALCVALVGQTGSVVTLLVAMVAFGICKGFYDSGISASLYDVIQPRARGTAAGLLNAIGWCGGALGPLFVGMVVKHGSKPRDWQNMSDAIAWCGGAYLLAALLVLAAIFLMGRAPNRNSGQCTLSYGRD
jgi:MFS family permease